ncbi:MAG: hypothetical protein K2F83_06500, partial [Oscillospiraceae bacterium]|nr:hypothetical protein [Oscillospiraceae bacterium]
MEHDCAQFTYHVIQHYVSDYMANGSATLRDPAVAENQTITWCNLHEECAAARTGKPNSLVKMVRAALAGERDKLVLLSLDEAESMAHLRSNERGTAFGSIGDLADALIDAVQGINTIKPWPATINTVSEDDWDAIQGWILSSPKPANMTELTAATKFSKDTAWWNEGDNAPGASSLQNLLDATQKALDTGRDAWINYYRYQDAFTDMKTTGVSPTSQWTRITENLVKDMDGNAFDDYDQFRTAIKTAVTAMGTGRTWNEYQYYIIHNADPNTDSNATTEYPKYWWHNGYSRITDLASLLTAAQMHLAGDSVIWDMFTLTDLYDTNLTQLHFRSGFNGTTDKYTDINDFKADVLAFIQAPSAIIATGSSTATQRNNSWNQLQYYLIHKDDPGGCDLTLRDTNLAITAENPYYWWKDAGEGAAHAISAGAGDTNIATLMEAVYRSAINGNPHALDNLTESAAAAFRLIPSYAGTEENWDELTKYDATTIDNLKTALNNLAIAAGGTNCKNLIWRQIQHYILTGSYLLATDPSLPTDTAADKDGAVRNYWWRLGDVNPNLTVVKNDLETFFDIIDQYNDGTITQADLESAIDIYANSSRLSLYGGTAASNAKPYEDLTNAQKNTFKTKIVNIAAKIKADGQKAEDALDWFVLQWYAMNNNRYTAGSAIKDKTEAKDYYVDTLLPGSKKPNWAPSYVDVSGASLLDMAMFDMMAMQPNTTVVIDPDTGIATVTTVVETYLEETEMILVVTTVVTIDPTTGTTTTTVTTTLMDGENNILSETTTTDIAQTTPVDPEEPVCTCGSEDETHAEDCPLYEAPEEPIETEGPVCTCGSEDGTHSSDCPLYVAPEEPEEPVESPGPVETTEPSETEEPVVSPEPAETTEPEVTESPDPTESQKPEGSLET